MGRGVVQIGCPSPLGHALSHEPERTAYSPTNRHNLFCTHLCTRNSALEPVLESFAQSRAALEHPAAERYRKRCSFVDEELARERADVKRELLDGQAHDRVGA